MEKFLLVGEVLHIDPVSLLFSLASALSRRFKMLENLFFKDCKRSLLISFSMGLNSDISGSRSDKAISLFTETDLSGIEKPYFF
jgi:hypothetical protein